MSAATAGPGLRLALRRLVALVVAGSTALGLVPPPSGAQVSQEGNPFIPGAPPGTGHVDPRLRAGVNEPYLAVLRYRQALDDVRRDASVGVTVPRNFQDDAEPRSFKLYAEWRERVPPEA